MQAMLDQVNNAVVEQAQLLKNPASSVKSTPTFDPTAFLSTIQPQAAT